MRRADPYAERGAQISDDGVYRYRLWRTWHPSRPRCAFVMLNPSTADGEIDDPTIRRCQTFARLWGFGALDVFNLYGLRATGPAVLRRFEGDAVGPQNDELLADYLISWAELWPDSWNVYMVEPGSDPQRPPMPQHPIVVCAWGAHGTWRHRDDEMYALLAQAHVYTHRLGLPIAGDGPRHPLYLRGDSIPLPYEHSPALS